MLPLYEAHGPTTYIAGRRGRTRAAHVGVRLPKEVPALPQHGAVRRRRYAARLPGEDGVDFRAADVSGAPRCVVRPPHAVSRVFELARRRHELDAGLSPRRPALRAGAAPADPAARAIGGAAG